MEKDVGGRPPKYDQKLLDDIVEYTKQNPIPLTYICAQFGRKRDTVEEWLKIGGIQSEAGEDTILSRFYLAYKIARNTNITRLADRIEGGKYGWQGSAWILERVFREEFGSDAAQLYEIKDMFNKLNERFGGEK